jgi:hypothetical protein
MEYARRHGREPGEAGDDAGPLEQAAVAAQPEWLAGPPVTAKFAVWTQPSGPSASELTGGAAAGNRRAQPSPRRTWP